MSIFKAGKTLAMSCVAGLMINAVGGIAFGATDDEVLIEEGREIFEETAGGVGCAMCHGATGTGSAELGAPYVRGVSAAVIDSALGGAVPVMEFLSLNQHEKDAVQAYLDYVLRAEETQLDPIAAAGKVIFEESAGGVGCASCHGDTGAGDIGIGPNIVNADAVLVFEQLQTNPAMTFIELTEDEVNQVSAYLRSLHDLEAH